MNCALDLPATLSAPTSRQLVSRLRAGDWSQLDDQLAEEVPVALEYNGVSHAVMMATPSDLEQFALGFSLSEGIIGSAREFYGADIDQGASGITVHIDIASAAFARLKDRRRSMTGRTGCGLCGVDSLAQVLRPLPYMAPAQALSARAIRRALAGVKQMQPLNRITGATHAALWCDSAGALHSGFEDVGRHNALDKLIGGLAQSGARLGEQLADGFALITSRASVEMVQKAATCGISALVAISAPTALAARTAQECGMTLVAFARGDDFVAYAHGINIILD
jgi:FdhD protein